MAKIICAGAHGTKNAGHGVVAEYDLQNHAAVAAARLQFNELMVQGAPVAFVVAPGDDGVKKAEKRITEFDPTAQEIVVMFPIVGG